MEDEKDAVVAAQFSGAWHCLSLSLQRHLNTLKQYVTICNIIYDIDIATGDGDPRRDLNQTSSRGREA